jgi:hypothetical protein
MGQVIVNNSSKSWSESVCILVFDVAIRSHVASRSQPFDSTKRMLLTRTLVAARLEHDVEMFSDCDGH